MPLTPDHEQLIESINQLGVTKTDLMLNNNTPKNEELITQIDHLKTEIQVLTEQLGILKKYCTTPTQQLEFLTRSKASTQEINSYLLMTETADAEPIAHNIMQRGNLPEILLILSLLNTITNSSMNYLNRH